MIHFVRFFGVAALVSAALLNTNSPAAAMVCSEDEPPPKQACSASSYYHYCASEQDFYMERSTQKRHENIIAKEKKRQAKLAKTRLAQEKKVNEIKQASMKLSKDSPKSPEPVKLDIDESNKQSSPSTTTIAENPAQITNSGSGLNADLLFDMVNQHRTQKGLPTFTKSPDLCSVAQSRAPELNHEINGGGGMHAGMRKRQASLSYRVNENIISNRNESSALKWWLNSSVHRKAIEGNYTHSCTACSGNQCTQLFANL